ncbi:MAG TPA: hypothetical protein VN697_08080 [Tepidiformaceae bacterium]|nr:hypothetical protein [Tepidiformaceae bacterium]
MTTDEVLATAAREALPDSLTERESQLLRQAGERVFALARKVSAAERREGEVKRELERTLELLTETRNTRDVLSAQVQSLLRERERDFEERSELRQLLGAITGQLQAAMNRPASSALAPQHSPGSANTSRRLSPESRNSRRQAADRSPDAMGTLARAARKQWSRLLGG